MLMGDGMANGTRIRDPSRARLMTSDMLPSGELQQFAQMQEGVGYGVDVGVVLDPARASFNGGPRGRGSSYWTGAYGSWGWKDPANDLIGIGMTQQDLAAMVHVGLPHPAPDLRALHRSMVYAALTEPWH
jgi:CubicO group peptidase (beta-lactamase class C family)